MLAIAFVEGANKSFKPLLSDSEQDCSLGDDKHPETVEEALQVLSMHEQQTMKRFVKKKFKSDDESQPLSLSFAQKTQMMKQGLCFKFGKQGHSIKDCPEKDGNKKEDKEDVTQEQSHSQQAWTVDDPPRGWTGWSAQSLAAATFVRRSVLDQCDRDPE